MHAIVTSDDNIVLKALHMPMVRRRMGVAPAGTARRALPACVTARGVGGGYGWDGGRQALYQLRSILTLASISNNQIAFHADFIYNGQIN
jgi:hypothetical protein